MTKHEAVRILELYNPFLGGDDKKLLSEAIDVAIEALNHFADDSKKVSSSCGQENDLISKADVCEILADVYPTDGEKVVTIKSIDEAYDAILALPSATYGNLEKPKESQFPEGAAADCNLDLINRAEAISACINDDGSFGYGDDIIIRLEGLPSAQPEKRTIKRTETHACDCISKEYITEHIKACWINGRPKHSPELCEVLSWIDDVPSAQPEIVRCCKCSYWDRDSLRHQYNDFRDWNEAECKILAERDPYDEINRYTEADDYCSRAERRTDG